MKNRIERKYYLRTGDFDNKKRLHPASILDLFQDVAGVHAEQIGCGFDSLIERGCLWVLVRTKYEQLSRPQRFQKVTVETWPQKPSRLGFSREYLIKNNEGEVIVKGTSDWVIIDSRERKIVAATDIYPEDNFCEDKNFPEKTGRLKNFETEKAPHKITPGFSQIDVNGHVNNIKYVNYVLDCAPLSDEDEIAALQIDYRKEVLSGEEIELFVKREEKEIKAKGCDRDGNILFMCEMKLK